MSAFYSSQAYANFNNEIMQQASQQDSQTEQYEDEEAQAKETSSVMGTELLAQSAPMLLHTVYRGASKLKEIAQGAMKAKTAVENGVGAIKAIPKKLTQLGEKLDDIGTRAVEKAKAIGEKGYAKASNIASDFTGSVESYKKMTQEKLTGIANDVRSKTEAELSRLTSNKGLTDALSEKYAKVISLSHDKSPEGLAKLHEAYTDFVSSPKSGAVKSMLNLDENWKPVKDLNSKAPITQERNVRTGEVRDIGTSRPQTSIIDRLTAVASDKVAKFKSMTQEKLNDISADVKDKLELNLSKLKARNGLTPELQEHYNKVLTLTGDKTPEGMAKLQEAYTDFKGKLLELPKSVSSMGKEAISKLNPKQQLEKLQSGLSEQKAKLQNFVNEKADTIKSLTNIHNDKLNELDQRRSTLQRKIQTAEANQANIEKTRNMEPRIVAPDEVSVFRSGGSVRVPSGRPPPARPATEDLTDTISGYKREMSKIDSRAVDLGKEHLDALKRVETLHTKNITEPLAKIDESTKSLMSAGATALGEGRTMLGATLDHIAPVLDIGFAGQSLANLGHENGDVGGTLNDLNMVRHGASSAVDVGKAGFEAGKNMLQKAGGAALSDADKALQAGKASLQKAGGESVDAVNEGLDATKGALEKGAGEGIDAGKEALQASKALVETTGKEAGSAIMETAGSVLGPIGEVADVALLAYSLFSGITDITKTPYIAPNPVQQINIVHQAGIT